MRMLWTRSKMMVVSILTVVFIAGTTSTLVPLTEANTDGRLRPLKFTAISSTDLRTTFTLKEIDGVQVPYQNGIPVPSFEPQQRLVLSLNGIWRKQRFHADHDFSMALRTPQWIRKCTQQGYSEPGYDDSHWATQRLPFPENVIHGTEAANSSETYQDGVWYRRTFVLGSEWQHKVITLKALSVSYVADFWINGKWIGYHEGGYTPFAFDITPYVKQGLNTIAIRIDNPPWGSRIDTIPAQEGTDFFNYTGVIQDMYLEGTSLVSISRVDIVPESMDGKFKATVVIRNHSTQVQTVSVQGTVYDTDPKSPHFLDSPAAWTIKKSPISVDGSLHQGVTVPANGVRAVVLHAKIPNPQLWSLGNPNLYVAEFTLIHNGTQVDLFDTQFGIRTIRTQGTQVLLNNHPVFLAGIARHEEWPDSGRTATWTKIKNDFEQIKSLHANFVRTAHYPNVTYTYILMDRLGLAAMVEIPVWQFTEDEFLVQQDRGLAEQMWREMILSEYNRPSILLWSTNNESSAPELRVSYNDRLVNDVRQNYNDGRLITQSAAANQPGFDDPSMAPLDVASWTMYYGVFYGTDAYNDTRQFLQAAHKKWPNKPILNTEFGQWSQADDSLDLLQTSIYRQTIDALEEKATVSPGGVVSPHGYLAGVDFWIMYNWYVNHNKWIDTFGIYHMDRKKEKPVGKLIASDYKAFTQGDSKLKRWTAPNILFTGNMNQSYKLNPSTKFVFSEPKNLSGYNYLQIIVQDDAESSPITVELLDKSNKTWSYQAHAVSYSGWYRLVIPLYRRTTTNLSLIKEIVLKSFTSKNIRIMGVYASCAGTDIPQAFESSRIGE